MHSLWVQLNSSAVLKLVVSLVLTFMAFLGPALACSCKTFTAEEIATNDKYEFTKLKINYPTVGEVWQRLKKWNAFHRPYSVTVLEDIKGTFGYSDLIVEVGDVEACGTSVSYGQTLYLIRLASGADEWGNSASVCNIKNEKFAAQVKSVLDQKKSNTN